ncbi:MAG: hypothetical protein FWG33_02585, partial [Oscillospiraceae bacterium]|nr:hypothetical protein [Oscillospiraceae bacterium]
MELSQFFKETELSQSVSECTLASVLFDKKKNVLTLYIKAEHMLDFSLLASSENQIKDFLDISDVRIMPEYPTARKPVENVVVINELPPNPATSVVSKTEVVSHDGEVLLGKKITLPPTSMESLSGQGEVVVSGTVFGKDSRTLKNGKTVTIISFTDKTSSVMLKFFTDSKAKTAAEKTITV